MIKFSAALKTILGSVTCMGVETVGLCESLGRVLAKDIYSQANVPGFDNSAMDGFAVRSKDVKKASERTPVLLEVIDDIRAGDVARKALKAGQAIRIMTGAPIPQGADCVVMVERTVRVQAKPKELISVQGPCEWGLNIREAGQDIQRGKRVVQKGELLRAAHVGLLASLGQMRVQVIRQPRVAILATGSELMDVGMKLRPGKIRSSNTYTLYSQVVKAGGLPINLGIAKDDLTSLEKKVSCGLRNDILITSGGVSVGEYDFVKDVLAKTGAQIKFWKVAIRPGKPLVFGQLGKTLIFGLPGNPVSSMVGFEIFVKPALCKMAGQIDVRRRVITAQLTESIFKRKGLRFFLRAQTHWYKGQYWTKTTGPQGSGILKSMVLANSLIILPENIEQAVKGQFVQVQFLD